MENFLKNHICKVGVKVRSRVSRGVWIFEGSMYEYILLRIRQFCSTDWFRG